MHDIYGHWYYRNFLFGAENKNDRIDFVIRKLFIIKKCAQGSLKVIKQVTNYQIIAEILKIKTVFR